MTCIRCSAAMFEDIEVLYVTTLYGAPRRGFRCFNGHAFYDPPPSAERKVRSREIQVNTSYKHGTATHCHRGHERTPENTLTGVDGRHRCRPCDRLRQRIRSRRRRDMRREQVMEALA